MSFRNNTIKKANIAGMLSVTEAFQRHLFIYDNDKLNGKPYSGIPNFIIEISSLKNGNLLYF